MPLASRVVRPGPLFANWRVSEAANLELTAGPGNGCPGQRLAEAAGAAPLSVPGCAQASGRLDGFRRMLLSISPGGEEEREGESSKPRKKKKITWEMNHGSFLARQPQITLWHAPPKLSYPIALGICKQTNKEEKITELLTGN